MTRQGMQNRRGLHGKKNWQKERERNDFFSVRAQKQVLTVKKNMHLTKHCVQ